VFEAHFQQFARFFKGFGDGKVEIVAFRIVQLVWRPESESNRKSLGLNMGFELNDCFFTVD